MGLRSYASGCFKSGLDVKTRESGLLFRVMSIKRRGSLGALAAKPWMNSKRLALFRKDLDRLAL